MIIAKVGRYKPPFVPQGHFPSCGHLLHPILRCLTPLFNGPNSRDSLDYNSEHEYEQDEKVHGFPCICRSEWWVSMNSALAEIGISLDLRTFRRE